MYLLLASVWLLGGIGLLAYELAIGTNGRVGPVGITFCFVLAAYNTARWYARRSGKNDEDASRIVQEARRRQNRERQRERSEGYDPNLDFTRPPEPEDRPPG